jgi:hypothetical protein
MFGLRGSSKRRCRVPDFFCSTGDGAEQHTLCESPVIPESRSKTTTGGNSITVHHERYHECPSRAKQGIQEGNPATSRGKGQGSKLER